MVTRSPLEAEPKLLCDTFWNSSSIENGLLLKIGFGKASSQVSF